MARHTQYASCDEFLAIADSVAAMAGGLMGAHYSGRTGSLNILAPGWRSAQRGALCSVLAHWAVDPDQPALVSMPTGSGKTAVAVALPFLAGARRTLVLVPSQQLRAQMAADFRTEEDLAIIGAVNDSPSPPWVEEITGRDTKWDTASDAEVFVALPYALVGPDGSNLPQPDFFDLIIVDEAHHAPAATWREVLDHFPAARVVLLTATPRRRDGKPLPGSHVFHYPLRRAIDDGYYVPVDPMVLPVASPLNRVEQDRLIAQSMREVLSDPRYSAARALARVATIDRATELTQLYRSIGVDAVAVHSRLSSGERTKALQEWRSGRVRCAVSVDMLGEGIDLPNLKVLAYHDKHKSTLATVQLLGRLARASDAVRVRGRLITVADHDVYPAIQDAVRELYSEDADWVELLPRLIDDHVSAHRADLEYARSLGDSSRLKIDCVHPVGRAVVYECSASPQLEEMFEGGVIPPSLQPDEVLWGNESVLYSGVQGEDRLAAVVTRNVDKPVWYKDDVALDYPTFSLHIIVWRPRANHSPGLLIMNTDDPRIGKVVRDRLIGPSTITTADASRLQVAFDSLDRVSVSSVGVRNVFAGVRGAPSYATFGGSRVENGLRASDTDNRALGHVMAQIRAADGSTTTAGLATEKAKIWQSRYLPLREYSSFCTDLAEQYWEPTASAAGPLLPAVARGSRLQTFPASPLLATLSEEWLVSGRELPGGVSLGILDIRVSDPVNENRELPMTIVNEVTGQVVWSGLQHVDGSFSCVQAKEVYSLRGYGGSRPLSDSLEEHPPTIHFLTGESVTGAIIHRPPESRLALPYFPRYSWEWVDTDIRHETARPTNTGRSIHEFVENSLRRAPTRGTLRWILCNDGQGEIADHIVMEISPNAQPHVELWHSKGAGGDAGVRITDMQVLVAQAIKSRRHFHDPDFWHRLGRRLAGQESPKLRVISGPGERALRVVLGLVPEHAAFSIADSGRPIRGKVVMVQPGLSLEAFTQQLARAAPPLPAQQIRELLTVAHDSCVGHGVDLEFVGSP